MLDAHIPFFEGVLIELNQNQLNLLYWCKFYFHNVYSLDIDDRPTEFVIDYDVLMDDWLKRKEFREKNKGRMKSATDHDQYISRE